MHIDSNQIWLSADDGAQLFVRYWLPEGKPQAVLHIVHGMAEHSGRYERFATEICQKGIAVWASDLRGHGKTANLQVNSGRRGGLMGHCADANGDIRICADIDMLNRRILEEYDHIPLFLMGHSWGSFLVQHYIEQYHCRLAGVILSGTRGPGGLKVKLSVPIIRCICFLKGPRNTSRLARALVDGPLNTPFKPSRTPYDWISRDPAEVDQYIADPLCKNLCSVGFYRDLVFLLNRIHRPEHIWNIPKDLPIYIFSGSADPVGDEGDSPSALVGVYRSNDIKDVEFTLYPGARHETLHETNREEVSENVINWLTRHIKT
ncbi:MAG: lysophospholipase [Treponema sp.]|nr:lysophospholipase [Treponema sp.]